MNLPTFLNKINLKNLDKTIQSFDEGMAKFNKGMQQFSDSMDSITKEFCQTLKNQINEPQNKKEKTKKI